MPIKNGNISFCRYLAKKPGTDLHSVLQSVSVPGFLFSARFSELQLPACAVPDADPPQEPLDNRSHHDHHMDH